jgi:LexA-binding, inner membrane-associated putative hydrolase
MALPTISRDLRGAAEDQLTEAVRAVPRWLLAALIACLLMWQAIDAVQARLPLSVEWAVLDEVAHAALALFALLCLQPAWGWRPVLVGVAAATLIDVDHVVAARSLLPADMMGLYARPLLHSVLGVLVIANLGAAFGGWRIGLAASVGAITHIARDAIAEPGVPLLVPLSNEWHMILPAWVLPSTLVVLACLSSFVLRACDSADKGCERARGGAANAHLDGVVTGGRRA